MEQLAGSHIFVDESARQGRYILCATAIAAANTNRIRTAVMALRPKGSSRIHMKQVDKRSALPIIAGVAALDARSTLFVVHKRCSTREARDLALGVAFDHLYKCGAVRAVIESCDQDQEDRRVIRNAIGTQNLLQYNHEPAGCTNALLWIPDIHAWAWGRGGKARQAIGHRITVLDLR